MKWISGCSTNACVEVAFNGDDVLIRDSKHPGQAPLVFTAAEFAAFLAAAVRGEFGEAQPLDPANPRDMVIVLLQESAAGRVRFDEELYESTWEHDGAVQNVTSEVGGMRTAGLLYKSLHTDLWRPTRAGREAIDRGGV